MPTNTQKRISMNSKSLQAAFPQVYQDLFGNYPIVTSSAVHVDFMAHNIGQRLGLPKVWQKLPLRLYCGFAPGGSKFEIRELHFDSKNNSFLEEQFEEIDIKTFRTTYSSWAKSRAPLAGGKIILLWENGHGRGLGANKYLSLAALPLLVTQSGFIEELRDKTVNINSSQFFASQRLKRLFYDTWELTILLSKQSRSSNALCFASLLSSNYPIVTYSQPVDDPVRIAFAPFVGFRMQDLFTPIPHGLIPDTALIFPGSASVRQALIAQYEEISKIRYIEIYKYLKSFISRFKLSGLEDTIENFGTGKAYGHEIQTFEFRAIEILKTIIQFYQDGNIESFISLCRAIKQLRYTKEIIEGGFSEGVQKLMQQLSATGDSDLAIIPMGVGANDGDVLVLGRQNKYRDHILKAVRAHNEYCLEFASWLDGWGEDGFRIDQHLDQGIKSDFIGPDMIKLITYQRNMLEKRYTRRADIDTDTFDLLLDSIEGRVWIRGKPTDSKTIPSQKGIVALLSFLLKRAGETIPNNMLDKSPYTNYRNELQGKLISPLEKLLNDRLHKKLGVTIHGGLLNFTINFDPKGLNIALIE